MMGSLFSVVQKLSLIRWHRILEGPGMMKGVLMKISFIIFNHLSKSTAICIYLFTRETMRLGKRSGWLFASLYLKQCASSLQKAYGGNHVPEQLPVPISLTRSGYPTIIPSFVRHEMRRHDDRADKLVLLIVVLYESDYPVG